MCFRTRSSGRFSAHFIPNNPVIYTNEVGPLVLPLYCNLQSFGSGTPPPIVESVFVSATRNPDSPFPYIAITIRISLAVAGHVNKKQDFNILCHETGHFSAKNSERWQRSWELWPRTPLSSSSMPGHDTHCCTREEMSTSTRSEWIDICVDAPAPAENPFWAGAGIAL